MYFINTIHNFRIEVQRSDNDDHFRRVRFNEASITVKDSQPGSEFKDIPDVRMVYISEFDVVGEGLTIYHVNKVIAETGQIIDDGTKQIYVNTAVDDGTDIAELMSCFAKRSLPKSLKNISKTRNQNEDLA